ncbi:hypothetical protein SEA_GUACAMOLE_46 [Gordonia phage Guacamole]|uniref:hypothetical protein n=1 Tax=Gordonia phage Guacamole TaxID=1821553 RepID=UPI00078D2972|nr:hypothetical protein BJD65_gp46 [Gordonia phage Guacamole]AMS03537.1 hypothetical protein SEA_GUACAMOLE_46 [Gordonia phage Guacamole]QDM56783.1 hypothetical protein SEA_JASPERJR_46 [Gordonia phage JasperJr]
MRTFRQEQHRGWGNTIDWSTPPGEVRRGVRRRKVVVGRLVGWLPSKPDVGDRVVTPMKSGRNAIFEVTAVEHAPSVWDMFWADVRLLGYEGEAIAS